MNTNNVLILSGTAIVVALIGLRAADSFTTGMNPVSGNYHSVADSYKGSGCNIGYVSLSGEMVTTSLGSSDSQDATSDSVYVSADEVTSEIRSLVHDDSIKGIVIAIDSGGGDPVAGEEIEQALKVAHKPTVALIRSQGDSAAYMAASGADTIYASAFSEVGSIGVTASYIDASKQNQKQGITYNQLSTGPYKDMFSPDKPMTDEEKSLVQRQLQKYLGHFVDIVSANRHIDRDAVLKLADGSAFTADDALQNGLIDNIGSIDDVRTHLSSIIKDKAVVCGIDTFE